MPKYASLSKPQSIKEEALRIVRAIRRWVMARFLGTTHMSATLNSSNDVPPFDEATRALHEHIYRLFDKRWRQGRQLNDIDRKLDSSIAESMHSALPVRFREAYNTVSFDSLDAEERVAEIERQLCGQPPHCLRTKLDAVLLDLGPLRDDERCPDAETIRQKILEHLGRFETHRENRAEDVRLLIHLDIPDRGATLGMLERQFRGQWWPPLKAVDIEAHLRDLKKDGRVREDVQRDRNGLQKHCWRMNTPPQGDKRWIARLSWLNNWIARLSPLIKSIKGLIP